MISSIIRGFDSSATTMLKLSTAGVICGYAFGNNFHLAAFQTTNSSRSNFSGLYISYDGVNYKRLDFYLDNKIKYASYLHNIVFCNGIFYISIQDVIDGYPPYYNYIYTTIDGINFEIFANFRPEKMAVVENNLFFVTNDTVVTPYGNGTIWDITFKNVTSTLTEDVKNKIIMASSELANWSWTDPEKYIYS